MIISRNQFFLVLFLIITVPFLGNRIIWLANAKKTTGVMAFISHGDWGSAIGMTTYAVIDFKAEKILCHSTAISISTLKKVRL
jgi:hypothetical protein